MKAQVLHRPGEPEQFSYQDWPQPQPGPGEVLVRQHATSVNPADCKIRRNGSALAPGLPAVLGADVAGEVVALGPGVGAFALGDQVFGCAGGVRGMPGSYAEFIAADVRLLARRPHSLSLRQAAALPLAGITAYEGLVDRARVRAGQRVLVYGATGGVGHLAVQIAKARGAHVTAVVSTPEKAALARSLGADEVVLYRAEGLDGYVERLTDGLGFDLVFDAVGGDNLNLAIQAARPQGQVVTLVARQSYDLGAAFAKGLSIHILFMLIPMLHDLERARHGEILRELARLADEGLLAPLLDCATFALADLPAAHRRLESGAALGKVVVDIALAEPVQATVQV
ncbi:zinc-dependent alcohol dehydrogenase family protein [Pseudomonas lalucatii]|uniref:Zinc-dependent alcohol dehydrogenase family protein n=1 Tax=Pseudomonas lalucatii TaxID=1424203 RepID=A0ABS5Q218_9PSED|nr:zinc-dependent alcohol dehydrogenase family protein [Pseudomonas lalucatii]MBS7662159.1 zinc-dependent alcohol dehydrogenase family protein [Pseudomonas lalucatii]